MRELDYTPPEPTRAQLEQQVEELEMAREADAETIAELRNVLGLAQASRRRAAQTLIEHIGADGPESVEETAKRAVAVIERLRAELAECEASRERLQMALTTAGLIPAIQETA